MIVVGALATAGGAARAESVDAFLGRLAAAGKDTRTLQAQLVQRKRLSLFRTEVVTKGRVLFERPDRLRWETFRPDASLLLLVGQRAEFRLPGEPARVIDLKHGGALGALVEQLFVWLGVRPARDIGRQYTATLQPEKRLTRLSLVPKEAMLRSRVKQLVLEVGADLLLQRIVVLQKDGDTTAIEFSSVKRNAKLPPNSFK
jgi:outer membrane lipoprotein carrier protein